MMVRNASNKAVIVDVLHLSVVRLAAAVHETLSPFMTEMKEDLAAIKTEMKEDLAAVKENLTSLTETVNDLSRDLEEINNQSKAEELVLKRILQHINDVEERHPVIITQEPQNTTVEHVLPLYECGGTGGWRRVVYLNMTDPNTNCPSGWQLTRHFKRTCGKDSSSSFACDSVFFPVSEGNYSSVCGSIRAYQDERTDAFEAYHLGRVTTIAMHAMVLLSPSHHLWVETISVNQESIQDLPVVFIQMILSGMVKAAVEEVAVAHSTILHTSLSNSPAPPLTL